MKIKVLLPALLLVGTILIASCALGLGAQTETGTLSFLFPMGSLSKQVGDTTYLVRVFYGLDLYDQEPTIEDDQITFTDLPLGEAWVFIAKGTVGSDEFFYPSASGDIEVTIVGGDNEPVTITLEDSPFQWSADLKGTSVVGLAELGGTVYAANKTAAGNGLYKGTYAGGTFITSSGPDLPADVEVSSLSVGKVLNGAGYIDQVWVNGSWSAATGSGGIMGWTASDTPGADTLDNGLSDGFANAANRKDGVDDLNVVYSGAFVVDGGVAIFFQRDGGLGGVYLDSPTEYAKPKADWPWIVDEINLGELLADVVEEPDDLILDLELSSTTAYLVSTLLTAKVSETLITGGSSDVSVDDLLSSDSVAYAPELGAPIIDIDLDETNGRIYIGTAKGLYVGEASAESGKFLKDGTQARAVSGTIGSSIEMVVSSKEGTYLAFVTKRGDDPDMLSLVEVATESVRTYRTLEGLPGEDILSLIWLDDNVLAIGGNRGLVAIDASRVF